MKTDPGIKKLRWIMLLVMLFDLVITLFGQPRVYWTKPLTANEGDPLVRYFIQRGLMPILLISLVYAAVVFTLVSVLPRRLLHLPVRCRILNVETRPRRARPCRARPAVIASRRETTPPPAPRLSSVVLTVKWPLETSARAGEASARRSATEEKTRARVRRGRSSIIMGDERDGDGCPSPRGAKDHSFRVMADEPEKSVSSTKIEPRVKQCPCPGSKGHFRARPSRNQRERTKSPNLCRVRLCSPRLGLGKRGGWWWERIRRTCRL